MDVNNMNQNQLKNMEDVLKTPNIKKIFDLNNLKVNDYVLKVLINDSDNNVSFLCSLIKDGKVNNFEQAVNFFSLLQMSSKTRLSIANNSTRYFNFDDENITITCTPLHHLLLTLRNYSNQKNLIPVAETIATMVSCDVSYMYYSLLQYPAFWSELNHINIIKELTKDNYLYFMKVIKIEESRKYMFRKMGNIKEYVDYHESQHNLIEYMKKLATEYKKDESVSRVNKLMGDQNVIIKESNASIRKRYPY